MLFETLCIFGLLSKRRRRRRCQRQSGECIFSHVPARRLSKWLTSYALPYRPPCVGRRRCEPFDLRCACGRRALGSMTIDGETHICQHGSHVPAQTVPPGVARAGERGISGSNRTVLFCEMLRTCYARSNRKSAGNRFVTKRCPCFGNMAHACGGAEVLVRVA